MENGKTDKARMAEVRRKKREKSLEDQQQRKR